MSAALNSLPANHDQDASSASMKRCCASRLGSMKPVLTLAAMPLTIQPAVADSRYPLFWQSKAI